MATAQLDLSFANNAAWKQAFQFQKETIPFALTEYPSLLMEVREASTSAEVVIALKSYGNSDRYLVVENAAQGRWRIEVPVAKASTIKAGTYVYDMLMKDAAGNVLRVMYGQLTVVPGVSRFV